MGRGVTGKFSKIFYIEQYKENGCVPLIWTVFIIPIGRLVFR